jgi:hypothetical protein
MESQMLALKQNPAKLANYDRPACKRQLKVTASYFGPLIEAKISTGSILVVTPSAVSHSSHVLKQQYQFSLNEFREGLLESQPP